jgi:hypothetical protein
MSEDGVVPDATLTVTRSNMNNNIVIVRSVIDDFTSIHLMLVAFCRRIVESPLTCKIVEGWVNRLVILVSSGSVLWIQFPKSFPIIPCNYQWHWYKLSICIPLKDGR